MNAACQGDTGIRSSAGGLSGKTGRDDGRIIQGRDERRKMGQTARNRIHFGAVVIYHIALVFYLLILMIRTIRFTEYGALYLQAVGERALPLLRVLMTVLLGGKLLRMKARAVPAVLLAAAAWIVGEEEILDLCLLTALSDLAQERRTLRTVIWTYAVLAFLMLLLKWQGMLETRAIQFSYRKGYSLGFGHPNMAGIYLISLDLMIWTLYLKRHKAWTAVLFGGSAAVCWLVLASRTSAVLLILYPFLAYGIERIGESRRSGLLKAAQALPLLLAVFSIGIMLAVYYQKIQLQALGLDRNMTLRFRNPAQELRILGGQITWLKRPDFLATRALDNQYTNTLLSGGVMGCMLLVVQMTWCMARLYRRRRWDLLAVAVMLCLYAVMECVLTRLEWNMIALILFSAESGAREEGKKPASRDGWIRLSCRGKVFASLGLACLTAVAAMLLPERNALPGKAAALTGEPMAVGALMENGSEERQSFRAEAPFSGLQVICATYYSLPAGSLRAELLDGDGGLLEQVTVNAWNVRDNAYLSIPFSREYPEGNYILKVGDVRLVWGHISLWRNEGDPYPDGVLTADGEETGGDWAFRLYSGGVSGRNVLQRDCLMIGLMVSAGIWMVPDLKRRKQPGR